MGDPLRVGACRGPTSFLFGSMGFGVSEQFMGITSFLYGAEKNGEFLIFDALMAKL